MGLGFWLIQAAFVIAAICTAIIAHRERDAPADEPRHVPIQPGSDFTIQEQARLLRLKARIRESRVGSGRLYDDLVPTLVTIAEAERVPPDDPDDSSSSHVPRGVFLSIGLALVLLGAGGVWMTGVAMDRQAPATLVERFVPGPLAHPGEYFATVNSAAAQMVAVESVALLDDKRAMDRWEAALCAGVALVLGVSALRSQRRGSSPLGWDLVGVFTLLALVCGGLSFFELP
jgi:hypothetical protein